MKRIGGVIFCLLFLLVHATGQLNRFQCTQVNENIRLIEYLSGNPDFTFQASDAVLLKGTGGCFGCEILDDKIRFRGSNILIQAPEERNGFQILLAQGEKIFGGGERAVPLNRRGLAFPLNNNPWYGYGTGADHLNYSVPFFISSRGYGVFFNNPSRGHIDIGKRYQHVMDVRFTGGALHMYIIEGKTYEEILHRYHELTGRQEMVPKWAMGLFMSRFGYRNEQEVFDIAGKMDKAKIPFDAVIFDLFWFGDSIKTTMGNLDWVNKAAWPEPQKMIKKLKDKGRNTILITEPFVLETSRTYQEAMPFFARDKEGKPYILRDFYFGKGGLLDVFRFDTKEWFLLKYEKQRQIGVAGWWGDLGEPEKHPDDMFHDLSALDFSASVPASHVHNLYGHQWTKMLYDHYKNTQPEYRLFSLNRAGFAGTQRYGIIPWTGDVSRSWDGFRAQLPLLTGMAMSGVPYIHSDAGGFAGGEKDPELYTRWFQFAVFTPILRPHGTAVFDADPGAVSYPSEPALIGGGFEKTILSYARLRYEMLPYNYNLTYRHYMYGDPLMAPMLYYFPEDEAAVAAEDQFMWGKDMLVAPVLEKGQTSRKVYLPEGVQWYSLQASHYGRKMQKVSGWQEIFVGDYHLPVFVREGAFVVLSSVKKGKHTGDFDNGDIDIHYYYSEENSTSEWYDDDGKDRLAMDKKAFDLLHFDIQHGKKESILKITNRNKENKGHVPERKITLYFHGFGKPIQVKHEGKIIKADKQGRYRFTYTKMKDLDIRILR